MPVPQVVQAIAPYDPTYAPAGQLSHEFLLMTLVNLPGTQIVQAVVVMAGLIGLGYIPM